MGPGQGGDGGARGAVTAAIDERGVLTEWSDGARRLLGYRGDEVVGRAVGELLVEGSPLSERPPYLRSWSGRVVLRHRDGHAVTGDLIARRRITAEGTDWLLVWSAPRGPVPLEPVIPAEWSFEQAPCILAVFDSDLRYVHANVQEERAVGLTREQLYGLRATEAVPGPASELIEREMRCVLESGERRSTEVHLRVAGEGHAHAWAIELAPLRDPDGTVRGVCFAALDSTEQYEARRRLSLLTEAGTRIGTELDMTRTAEQLAELLVPRLADAVCVDLLAGITGGGDPDADPDAGPVVLHRAAVRSVLPDAPEFADGPGAEVVLPESSRPAEWLTAPAPAGYRNGDPDLARWEEQNPAEAARMRAAGVHSVLVVPLRARGAALGTALLLRHRAPDPFTADDLRLAQELADRAAVSVDNARRYTRERETVLTLQRNLLPHQLPQPTAVEAASAYLPASGYAEMGGDWFDVIPLSGARVGLVIGDVVGHGLKASAGMGRLRTAVRTLADIDLPPDELLTHLDDLVLRMLEETSTGTITTTRFEGIGATCLYAVYDPVSRRLTAARAGHVPPLLRRPDGTVDTLELPAGPPLGVGGLPFESVETELAEGTDLFLYTDGLVARRAGGFDAKLGDLRAALARPADGLQAACDAAIAAVLPQRHDDDVAVLLARTRTLPADRVATWDVPHEPGAVAQARKDAMEQLAAWELEELSFVVELVVSELVTNAVRHGSPPVRLRLILDRGLLCEVSDTSGTAPYMKRARAYDEGGRGLLLVAQLAQRWGTRYDRNGKTIWAEVELPRAPRANG
ncbi:hypothetical protein SRB5_45060 [Streptomyces sp. RB5]|uniref:protein-serine/threonine phosphatase n=1 Tax=Streptomyces smaragdinus TaxID=2585196 RepID=A0A7K0CMS7_9ACTN|nr:SpoIIE family protein phosphatase [Streptomyces smaragdinus]MQY14342.1 hypothetical protein [Streptomyces smaragdinus]